MTAKINFNVNIYDHDECIMTTDYNFVEATDTKDALLTLISRLAELGAVCTDDYDPEELSDFLYQIHLMTLAIMTEKYNCFVDTECVHVNIRAEDLL